ncbi:MAG: hypothetical protein HBSIN02_07570 [Bacteroidia bacterium]|nr:MAG: hypothetical protein HBSIN02_07570 [Bacteroidia bacterium]
MPHRRVDLHPPKPADFEAAVESLLRPPSIDYLRTLKDELLLDPQYLFFHEQSVGLKIQSILALSGIRWDDQTMQFYWPRVLRVAFERLESKGPDQNPTD